MKKLFILLFSFLLLTSQVYSAGSGGSEGSSGSGDGDNIQDGPKPASKFRLAYKEVERANKAAKKGKLEKAQKKYEKALKFLLAANAEDPGNPDILNYLGFTSRKLGDYKCPMQINEFWKFEGKFILFFTSFVNGRLVCVTFDTLFLSSFSMDEKVIFRHKSTSRIQNNC